MNADAARDPVDLNEREDAEAFANMLVRARAGKNPFLSFPSSAQVADAFATLTGASPDEWCGELSLRAERHAENARSKCDPGQARDEWLSAYCYWQVARYPVADTPCKEVAYAQMREAFDRYVEDDAVVTTKVVITTTCGAQMPTLLREPQGPSPRTLVVVIGGLDMWKEEVALVFGPMHTRGGRAVLTVDAPGTGQSPFAMSPQADEGWKAIVRWATAEVDYDHVVVHGISMGGYWAARVAHLWPRELTAVVNHGGSGVAATSRSWLENWTDGDYPFGFLTALAHVTRATSFEDLLGRLNELSLEEIAEKPCSPMLLVNGVEDRTARCEDMMWLLMHGDPKAARFFPGGHMGMTPSTLPTISSWIESVTACAGGDG